MDHSQHVSLLESAKRFTSGEDVKKIGNNYLSEDEDDERRAFRALSAFSM